MAERIELPTVTLQCQRPDGGRYETVVTGFPTAHRQLLLTPEIVEQLPNGMWTLTHTATGYTLGNYSRPIKALLALAELLAPFDLDFPMPDNPSSHPQYEQITTIIRGWFFGPSDDDSPAVTIRA